MIGPARGTIEFVSIAVDVVTTPPLIVIEPAVIAWPTVIPPVLPSLPKVIEEAPVPMFIPELLKVAAKLLVSGRIKIAPVVAYSLGMLVFCVTTSAAKVIGLDVLETIAVTPTGLVARAPR